MANESRRMTRRVLELAEEGIIDWEQIARDTLNWMSEAEVAEFADSNGYFEFEEQE
jgi:aldehyde:ferredoxin oxidoreductase